MTIVLERTTNDDSGRSPHIRADIVSRDAGAHSHRQPLTLKRFKSGGIGWQARTPARDNHAIGTTKISPMNPIRQAAVLGNSVGRMFLLDVGPNPIWYRALIVP